MTALSTETRFRQWYPLTLMFLTVGLSVALVFPFLTVFLTDAVRATPLQVSVFLLAAPLSSVLMSSLVGNLSDRYPIRRRLIVGAALAGGAASLLTAFVRDYWVLLAVTVTATAFASAMLPQLFAYARTSLAGSPRAAMTMSSLRTLFSVSWVVGPFLASILLRPGSSRSSTARRPACMPSPVWSPGGCCASGPRRSPRPRTLPGRPSAGTSPGG